MNERNGLVTLHGNAVTLLGQTVSVGDTAPRVELIDNGLGNAALGGLTGKVQILLSVPSLDTPVCDTEARRFNEAAADLGDDIAVAVISTDLPFAQARWCGQTGSDRVKTLSDHRDTAFGSAYGVLIKGLRLLARAAFIVDRSGKVTYASIVPEITQEPNYDEILAAARQAL